MIEATVAVQYVEESALFTAGDCIISYCFCMTDSRIHGGYKVPSHSGVPLNPLSLQQSIFAA